MINWLQTGFKPATHSLALFKVAMKTYAFFMFFRQKDIWGGGIKLGPFLPSNTLKKEHIYTCASHYSIYNQSKLLVQCGKVDHCVGISAMCCQCAMQ